MTHKTAMVCATVKSGITPVPGSVITNCVSCKCELWISGESLFEHPDAVAQCLPCALPDIQRDDAEFPQAKSNPLVQQIVKELRESGPLVDEIT